MRLLITNYEFPPLGGGAGKLTHGLATRLAKLGDEVDVLTMGSRGLERRETVDGVSVVRVDTNRRDPAVCTVGEAAQYVARALPVIRSLARERRYDLIHSHFILPDGLLAMHVANATGVPYVITAHGTDVPGHNPHRVRSLHAMLRPLWRRVTTRAALVVCPSAVLADRVARADPRAKVAVIPNAFDAARFQPRSERADRVLTVSRLIKLKGLQYLLHALSELDDPGEVVIAGDGPYASTLQKLARDRSLPVRFTGWLDNDSRELRSLYETSQIFVFPSEAENCPLALLEAMAAGLPIVTTTDRGCQSVVGDAALLIPPRDPLAMADAIRRLRGDEVLRRRLGEAARRRVVEHFSWDALVGRYREVYGTHVG